MPRIALLAPTAYPEVGAALDNSMRPPDWVPSTTPFGFLNRTNDTMAAGRS